jgi:hypothetical protein
LQLAETSKLGSCKDFLRPSASSKLGDPAIGDVKKKQGSTPSTQRFIDAFSGLRMSKWFDVL